jgi:hypothetical protein
MSLEKIQQHKEETMQFESDEIEIFRDEIERGEFSPKCLKCYIAGGRWCGYWDKNYNCEEIEEGEAIDLAKKFYLRERKK